MIKISNAKVIIVGNKAYKTYYIHIPREICLKYEINNKSNVSYEIINIEQTEVKTE